jgi:hypothetical protein
VASSFSKPFRALSSASNLKLNKKIYNFIAKYLCMHKDWLIAISILAFGFILLAYSYETNLFNSIQEYIKKLIEPITVGILP